MSPMYYRRSKERLLKAAVAMTKVPSEAFSSENLDVRMAAYTVMSEYQNALDQVGPSVMVRIMKRELKRQDPS